MNALMRVKAAAAVLFGPARTKAIPLTSIDDRGGWRLIHEFQIGSWQQDSEISLDTVLQNTTVWACMTLIASDIAKCCIRLMEKDGYIWSETESPAFSPVLRKPNGFQTRQQFMETWILSKLAYGNTYVLKERDNRGIVVAEYVLDPQRVFPKVSPRGEVFYDLQNDELSLVREPVIVPAAEIIHDRFNCLFHPLIGLSPIFANGLAAVQGYKIQKNSAKFFENMSRPSGILTAPGSISDATAARLKASWEANYGGNKFGKVAVLGDDLKYQNLGMTAVDSQMVEQAKFSAETICSTFHVPAFKVGAGTIPAGQKVEDLNQIYYSDCLHSLMDAIQTLQTEGLGLEVPIAGRRLAVQFDLDDLLKMDTATFIASIKVAIDASVMSPNEGRRKLNLPPVAGGEAPLSQQQNWSLAQLADRGAIPDAPSVAAPPPEPKDDAEEEMRDFYDVLLKGLEPEHA